MEGVFAPGEWEKLYRHFGEDVAGMVRDGLARYGRRWGLRDLRFIPYYSVNCLFTACSGQYGDVVLKLGPVCPEMLTECAALRDFDGRGFCRLYEAEPEDGALLLERILPGTPLRAVKDRERRLELFCGVYRELPRLPMQEGRYPTYQGWAEKIAATMRRLPANPELSGAMQRARTVFGSLWDRYPQRILLHGDLHHDNILLSGEGGYRAIDPKGVIGDPLFSLARFLLNEPYGQEARPLDFLQEDVEELAARLGYPAGDIARCFYVEAAMCSCWSVEDGAPVEEYPALEREVALAASLLARYE